MNQTNQSPNKAIVALIVVVLVGIVAGGGYFLATARKSTDTASDTTSPGVSSSSTSHGNYKDGSYDATGSYGSPAGLEKVVVSLTLADGKITGASVTSLADDATAKQYQEQFIGGYEPLVVGRSIDDVKLDVVAGSSLTSAGFNDAIDQIKQHAAA